MKNSYNPYSVPDVFFETVEGTAVENYSRRRRLIRRSLVATLAAVAVLVAVPALLRPQTSSGDEMEAEEKVDNLAQMYEYDIFLQVSF